MLFHAGPLRTNVDLFQSIFRRTDDSHVEAASRAPETIVVDTAIRRALHYFALYFDRAD